MVANDLPEEREVSTPSEVPIAVPNSTGALQDIGKVTRKRRRGSAQLEAAVHHHTPYHWAMFLLLAATLATTCTLGESVQDGSLPTAPPGSTPTKVWTLINSRLLVTAPATEVSTSSSSTLAPSDPKIPTSTLSTNVPRISTSPPLSKVTVTPKQLLGKHPKMTKTSVGVGVTASKKIHKREFALPYRRQSRNSPRFEFIDPAEYYDIMNPYLLVPGHGPQLPSTDLAAAMAAASGMPNYGDLGNAAANFPMIPAPGSLDTREEQARRAAEAAEMAMLGMPGVPAELDLPAALHDYAMDIENPEDAFELELTPLAEKVAPYDNMFTECSGDVECKEVMTDYLNYVLNLMQRGRRGGSSAAMRG